jgi:hypothetical protein
MMSVERQLSQHCRGEEQHIHILGKHPGMLTWRDEVPTACKGEQDSFGLTDEDLLTRKIPEQFDSFDSNLWSHTLRCDTSAMCARQ